MGSKPTKKQRVLRYLRGGTSLTPREAIDFFNAYRLAGIVHELNKEGYNIINLRSSGHARYKMVKPGETIEMEL